MKPRLKLYGTTIGLLALGICLWGCVKKVDSSWRDYEIVADGYDDEWQGGPSCYDRDRKVGIRVVNDAEAFFLCIAAGDPALERQLRMDGLTLWLDPQGGQARIFGIHLPGGRAGGLFKGPGPDDRTVPFKEGRGSQPDRIQRLAMPTPIVELSITYKDATGPLKMTMAEVRRTGIRIGRGQPGDGRLVYEFIIHWKAAPSLGDLKPGMLLGIGIIGQASSQEGPGNAFSGDRIGPDGFGGMGTPGPGGGPGSPRPGARGVPLEIWLQTRLARQISE